MAAQGSTALRNAQADQIETVIGASPILQFRTGVQPANCAAADAGTLLGQITLPADWLSAAANGLVSKLGTWSVALSSSGPLGHFRIKDSAGTVCHIQGSVTAVGGGGDMTVDNVNGTAGQTITVNTFSWQVGNG